MQALQMVCSKPTTYYDVIVLDINMPIMDGFEACNRIHNYFKFTQSLSRDPCDVAKQFSHSQKFKVNPLSDGLGFVKQRSLFENKNPIGSNVICKTKTALIIALTADESPEMSAKIESHPFHMQCSRLTAEMVRSLLIA